MPLFGDFYKGINKSKYQQNGWDDLSNVDIHSEPGSVKPSLATIKESSTTVTEATLPVVVPTGDTYLLSKSSGKIWKRTTGGSYSLAHTNSNATGHLGGRYYNGKLYYATASKLGTFDLASTWTDSAETFTNADTAYKPMAEVNDDLFIGDGNFVASVDSAGTFSANALDLQAQHRISALEQWGTELLIGTFAGAYFNKSGVFRWDTYSPSWNYEDYIDEVGINCFIPADNHIYAQAGTIGNLYYYDGTQLVLFYRIRDVTTGVMQEFGSTNLNGLPLFINKGIVYSIGRRDQDFPLAICKEYTASVSSTVTSYGVLAVGSQVLITWYDGSNYGVDKLDVNYANGTITTPEVEGKPRNVIAKYDSLPTGTSLSLELKMDGGAWTAASDFTQDSINKQYFLKNSMPATLANFVQARVTLNSSTTSYPVVKSVEIE